MKSAEKYTSYDEIPYESKPFSQSHPDRLATLGRLFGLSPAPVTQCRVLELGCASGGNLIPMAYHLPQSEFVGIDLSRRQVQTARKIIADLKLGNIRIEHTSIMDVDNSWGCFDYVIAHGIYSWVPDDVQDKILAIASENMAPQGIAYVSYNTYPGWHMREMIRRMMLYHADQFEETSKRIEQARALVDFLARSVPTENNHYGLLLKNELDLIRRSSDSYLFHDHMEEVNEPVYFYQFVERAEKHGLQYLGEVSFSTMLAGGFPKEVAEILERISKNIIRNEQYMDFVRNRQFRQTLLCHKDLPLKRALGGEDVDGLLVASSALPKTVPVNLSPGVKQSFVTPEGLTVETDYPLTKAALTVLKQNWPRAVHLETVFQKAEQQIRQSLGDNEVDTGEGGRILADDLLHCYIANVVEFRTWQADFIVEVGKRPKVSSLAAYLAGIAGFVVNQRHEPVTLDPLSHQLVRHLDGTRDHASLLQRLQELVEDGTLEVREHGTRLGDSQQIQEALGKAMQEVLLRFAGSALLV